MRFDDIHPNSSRVALWGLPDPDRQAAFYANVASKRLLAWCVDVVIIGIITAVMVPFTLFIGLFFLPPLFAVISFMYRVVSLANWSGTPGMRLMAIELRTTEGARLDLFSGFLHTLGYAISVAFFPIQLVSIVLMLTSARGQGLTDYVLGTAALNRVAA